MDKQEKIEFVRGITELIANSIIGKIEDDRIPDNWDGIELRQFIEDKAKMVNFVSMDRKRKREYNNTVLVNDL